MQGNRPGFGLLLPVQQRVHPFRKAPESLRRQRIGTVAYVDQADLVAFTVEAAQIGLVTVFEIVNAGQVGLLRALLQIIPQRLGPLGLRARMVQTPGIQSTFFGADMHSPTTMGRFAPLAICAAAVAGSEP